LGEGVPSPGVVALGPEETQEGIASMESVGLGYGQIHKESTSFGLG